MNISFENPDKINGLMTITVEEADYKDTVEKTLKDYRKRANIPGFRPGMVPMGLIKRQFGESAKADAINKFIGEQLYKYIKDNQIQMLGDPLPDEKQEPVDLKKEPPYVFKFDVAVAPEFKCELTGRDKIDYYDIKVDDALINEQVNMLAAQMGHYAKVDEYQEGDTLKGDLRQLDDKGQTLEGGLTVEGVVEMPQYLHDDDQKALFNNAKPGDVITFNPRKAYTGNDAAMAALLKVEQADLGKYTGDFSFQVTEITRFENHEINQELFDKVFGKDACKDEKEFREKIAEGLKPQMEQNADYKFLKDVRTHCEKKVGKLEYPDALLKRIMLANNKDKDEAYVDKNYEPAVKQLTWHLIKEQLVKANNIKVEDADLKAAAKNAARAQFAQYGMSNVPDEYVDHYADEMLKKEATVQDLLDQAVDAKLTTALKNVVKLNHKEVTLEEFRKLLSAE